MDYKVGFLPKGGNVAAELEGWIAKASEHNFLFWCILDIQLAYMQNAAAAAQQKWEVMLAQVSVTIFKCGSDAPPAHALSLSLSLSQFPFNSRDIWLHSHSPSSSSISLPLFLSDSKYF